MIMALDQLFHPTNDHSRFPSAERFAMGKELSEHILALNPPQGDDPKFWSYPAIARYHENGNEVRAIELVELARRRWTVRSLCRTNWKQHLLPDLLQALANYKLRTFVTARSVWFRKKISRRYQSAVDRGGKIKKDNWSKWLTGQFVHFPGVAAARRVHAARGRSFAAGSRLESS
ncbi:hypothetical protein [Mesorhizobium sp. M0019]|uniref:hypothetical protein n=1 Tax=Mesorhizobium sp. M0019 TaxID=2956845 RepID=UPI00333DB079